jgi:RNA polymerase sigma-70 factor, ECF subfamily
MSSPSEKFADTIEEAVHRLLSRAENSRGLNAEAVSPRIHKSLEKYLFKDAPNAGRTEVRDFIDEVRADDLCLIIACEKGDEAGWEDLVANFDATVRSAARKMSPNKEDAEDLASSIWAELYGLRQDAAGNKKSKLAYYSGRGSLAGWLRAVVSQLAIDQYRKQAKLVQVEEDREMDNLANDAAGSDNGLVSVSSDPETIFSQQEASADLNEALQNAIAGLEPEDRLILKLYYFDDLRLKDIAATFGYHEATASRKLVRVQAGIRQAVERELRERHGWSEAEIGRYLAEAAEKTGFSLEKMIGMAVLAFILQEIASSGVL